MGVCRGSNFLSMDDLILTEIDLFAWPAGNEKVANVNHEPFYNDTLLKRRNQRRSRCAQRLWEFFFFLLFITDSAPSLQNLILVHRQQQHQWRDLWKRYLAILSFAHPHGLASCVICVILINFDPLKASRSNHTWRSFLSVIIRVCVFDVASLCSTSQREAQWPAGCYFPSSNQHVPDVSQAAEKNCAKNWKTMDRTETEEGGVNINTVWMWKNSSHLLVPTIAKILLPVHCCFNL